MVFVLIHDTACDTANDTHVASFLQAATAELACEIARRMMLLLPSTAEGAFHALEATCTGPAHESLCQLPRDQQLSVLQHIHSQTWSSLAAKLLVTPPEWQDAACSSEAMGSSLATDGAALSLLNPKSIKSACSEITTLQVEDVFHSFSGDVLDGEYDDVLQHELRKQLYVSDYDLNEHIWSFPSLKRLHLTGMLYGRGGKGGKGASSSSCKASQGCRSSQWLRTSGQRVSLHH
jgi:hypothetical protein